MLQEPSALITAVVHGFEDLRAGLAALKDPADPVLEWSDVRDALLVVDEAKAVSVGLGPAAAGRF